MREIKFRAWCQSNKEMYYPDNIYEFWVDNNSVGFYPRYDKDELYHFNTSPSEGEKEIVVMQYTGLKDIAENEVYDGDVIKNCDTNLLEVVYWNEDKAAWYCRYVEDEKRVVSLADSLGNLNFVIGNIYEHGV